MKLLFVTQTIDESDSFLGFVHRWVEKFAEKYELIIAVCLKKGQINLPQNVKVLSLGKEREESKKKNLRLLKRSKYIFNFCRYIWRERNNYDAVLVHMNQEYVLLGGLLWKILGKRIYMWRNHYAGSFFTDTAAVFCDKIFCTSRFSYTAKFKKTVLMPVGIDTEFFRFLPAIRRIPRSILFYGRIAPSKHPELLIEALARLNKASISFSSDLIGDVQEADRAFYENVKRQVNKLGLSGKTMFLPGVPYTKGPEIFNSHEIFVNLSSSGMYDKTLFEAAACGCLVLARSDDFGKLVDERFTLSKDDSGTLAEKLKVLLDLSDADKISLGGKMIKLVEKQSLRMLVEKIIMEITSKYD